MEKTLEVLNRLEDAGLIGPYAIGGAVAAAYYVEPTVTYDLDIFTVIPGSSFLIDLAPIYSQLKAWGYREQGAGIVIEGWEVQFLPPPGLLEEAALEAARSVTFNHVSTRLLSPEFLCAIMLKVARPKDLIRLSQFLDDGVLSESTFREVLRRFQLRENWERFIKLHFEGREPNFLIS